MIGSEAVSITADTSKFQASLEDAGTKIRRIYWDKEIRDGYTMHRIGPDWEARLWDLTSKLAVKMADRCQDGLMGPEEFGMLAYSMASWTVSAAYHRGKPQKPATHEDIQKEIQKLFGGSQK